MEYRYNYNFLLQWMEVNKKTKKEVLQALGTQDYPSIKKWVEGTVPMHVEAILRLCNTFSIPIGAFFYDEEQIKKMPNADIILASLQPEKTERDNISSKGKGKISGETVIEKRTSILPPFVDTVCISTTNATSTTSNLTNPSTAVLGGNMPPMQSAESMILKTQLQYERQIRSIEQQHKSEEDKIRRDCQATFDAERNRLMDMIERLQNEVKMLHQGKKDHREDTNALSMRGQYYHAQDGEAYVAESMPNE